MSMSPSEMRMPRSAIKYRPIFTTPQVAPLVLRASQFQATPCIVSVITSEGEREPGSTQWHIFFCLGMAITLALLLFGHFVG